MRNHLGTSFRLLFIAVSLCLISAVASAQEVTGSLVGRVTDANGAAVTGATVTITDSDKKVVVRTVSTDGSGEFSAPTLPSSFYDVAVEAPNFKKHVEARVKLDVGQRRNVEVMLEPGNIQEAVLVESAPVAIELTTAASSSVVNGDQARELSLNNRNWVQLVTLAPGVSNDLSDQVYTGTTAVGFENGSTATTAQASQPNTIQISVNGARSSQNTFTVDGADITDRGSNLTIQAYPSVDSIGEFRVLRSLYPAEAGRSGGGQVNVITRSGTRDFHGSVFGFVRNEVFNANDFFGNQLAPVGLSSDGKAKRKPFRYLNAGWTLGGPVYLFNFGEDSDGLGRKLDRTFFFFSQEFRRDRRSPTLFSTVPDANLKQGIFRVPICLQVTGGACSLVLPANTRITNFRPISTVAQQYVNFIYNNLPPPTNPAAFSLNFPTPNEADFRQEIIKIDHSFNDNVSAFYRYQRDTIPTRDANAIFSSGSGIPFVSTTETESPGKTHTAQLTWVASPNLIFEGRYNFGYGAILSKNVGLLALANSPITPQLSYQVTRDRVPTVTFAGGTFSSLTGFGPYDNFSWKSNLGGSMTWVFGKHTSKYGVVFSKYRKNENALAGVNEGQFSGLNTPGGSANTIAPGGSATQQQWANFLQGTNITFTQAKFDYTADFRQDAFEAFAQDEWRARGNLTLYYGVRQSFFGSPKDKNGRLTNFVPELWNPAAAPFVTGAGNRVVATGVPTGNWCNGIIVNSQNPQTAPNCTPTISPWGESIMDMPTINLAPRVGLAWDPFSKGKSVLRTGYGIYHDQVLNGMLLQNVGTNPPYQITCQNVGTRLDQPVPPTGCPELALATVPSLRAIDPHWKTPYVQHWSLDWQQQLTNNTVVTVGYYGSKGTHIIGSFELNLLPPNKALDSMCASGSSFIGQTPAPTLVRCQVPGTAFTSSASEAILDQIRPFRGFRAITAVQPRFNSNYHSLQVSAQHRFSGSSQANFAYTWAKNLTDSQNDRSAAPQNSFDISIDRARAALDRRHILTMNYIYYLPFYKTQKGFAGKALGGWQASGIITYNTGLPFTATTSNFDPAGLGLLPPPTTVARPRLLCDPNANAPHTSQQWFNTACFARNPTANTGLANVIGNAGRGIINGPPTSRVDFTLSKNVQMSENVRLQLRGEVFNIFNHTNFRGLSTNVTAATFGQAISTRDPRTMQFGAKLYF